ncbi:MAG: Crp/Fnr family transcriptional regulator [bacterium]
MNDFVTTLKHVFIFEALDNKSLEDISRYCKPISYPAGDLIFMSEDQGKTFYIIRQGKVKISLAANNLQDVTVSLLEEGDFFGEMSILDESPRAADVIALSDVKLLIIYKDDFWTLLMKYPIITISLLKKMCQRLRKTNTRVKNKNASSLEKTIQALMEVADNHGKITKEGILLPGMTHQEWAFFAELSRETFTKSLSILKKEDLLTTHALEKKSLIIKNIEKLKIFCDSCQQVTHY